MNHIFPFGQPLRRVEQADRSGGKEVFVLGVYSSAVHARWVGEDGETLVSALAVDSEPKIFWRPTGDAELLKLLGAIDMPKPCGRLEAPQGSHNGPSGEQLDHAILDPLAGRRLHGDRSHAWLSDLLPESRVNPSQAGAIYREYVPRMCHFNLPVPTVPLAPNWNSWPLEDTRRAEILAELDESEAECLVVLGDVPIRAFLSQYLPEKKRLADFGDTEDTYGRPHPVNVQAAPKLRQVIALTHPRQTGGMGRHSKEWRELHERWVQRQLGECPA